jgi:hypothetical protein
MSDAAAVLIAFIGALPATIAATIAAVKTHKSEKRIKRHADALRKESGSEHELNEKKLEENAKKLDALLGNGKAHDDEGTDAG